MGEVFFFFFFGLGESEPDLPFGLVFFFFFPFAVGSFVADFFAFGVSSGVSLGFAEIADSSVGVFFFFGVGFDEGDGVFFFFLGDVFDFGVGLGASSSAFTACALRTGVDFSSSVGCAWRTKVPMIAATTRKLPNRPTVAQRNRVLRAFNWQRN